MKIELCPIAYVENERLTPIDDDWNKIPSKITLSDEFDADCLENIEEFSHLEVLFYFDKSKKTVIGAQHPRGNKEYPKMGIFAQRKKDRPNHIGATIVELVKHEGKSIWVKGLDAIDKTPILDIKPVFNEFLPQKEITQAQWATDLMKNYWEIK